MPVTHRPCVPRWRWVALLLCGGLLLPGLGVPIPGARGAAPAEAAVLNWGNLGQTLLGPNFGIPSVQREPTPQQVLFPLGVRITAVAAGGSDGRRQPSRGSSVALASDGTVWSWGSTAFRDGPQSVSTPLPVPGLTGVIAIAAGADHRVALRGDGTVWTWGGGRDPERIAGLERITAIAAGGDRTVALRDDGTVWQAEWVGSLFSTTDSKPERVAGLEGIVAIAAGGRAAAQYDASRNFHGLALGRDGAVWNWGLAIFGQLGDATAQRSDYQDVPAPVPVPSLHEIVALGAGNTFSYAVGRDGRISGWGANNNGQLGAAPSTTCYLTTPPDGCTRTPVPVPCVDAVRAIAGGDRHGVALRRDGSVWAWGANDYGQLGVGVSGEPRPSPRPVPGLADVAALAVGYAHALALRTDGTVWGWGLNEDGEVGNGRSRAQPVPAVARLPQDVAPTQVAAGLDFSLALAPDGRVWGWGANAWGQFGDGPPRPDPLPLAGLDRVVAIAAGGATAWALRDDGVVWLVGRLPGGQIAAPRPVADLTDVAAIGVDQAGYRIGQNGVAIRRDGTAWLVQEGSAPLRVTGLPPIRSVAPGSNQSNVAIARDGTVWSWEWDGSRQSPPTPVPGLDGVTAVASGDSSMLALRQDGSLWTWRRDREGNARTPIQQVQGLPPLAAIETEGPRVLALATDGTVRQWQVDGAGQQSPPEAVLGLTGITAIAAGASHSLAITTQHHCFAETGACASAGLLDYWQRQGGLARFGFPLTNVRDETLEDGRRYQVQWFERVRLEYHPENPALNQVLLGQFGRLIRPAEPPVAPRAGDEFFPTTGHNVAPRFAGYWRANGGLAQYGYPLGEAFVETLEDGRQYTVQYFERARFEYHPEQADPQYQVLLGQFGRRLLAETRGGR